MKYSEREPTVESKGSVVVVSDLQKTGADALVDQNVEGLPQELSTDSLAPMGGLHSQAKDLCLVSDSAQCQVADRVPDLIRPRHQEMGVEMSRLFPQIGEGPGSGHAEVLDPLEMRHI